MPYHVVSNSSQCPEGKKFAVVKSDTGKVVPGGCHETKKQAVNHYVALKTNVKK